MVVGCCNLFHFSSRGEDFEVTWTVEGEDNIDSTNDVSRKYIRTLVTRDYFSIIVFLQSNRTNYSQLQED